MKLDDLVIDPDKEIYILCHDFGQTKHWYPLRRSDMNDGMYATFSCKAKRGKIIKLEFFPGKRHDAGKIYTMTVELTNGDTATIHSRSAGRWGMNYPDEVFIGYSPAEVWNKYNDMKGTHP